RDPLAPADREPPQIGAPNAAGRGAERECLEDVDASRYAAIDKHGNGAVHDLADGRQRVDGRDRVLELAAAMVRDLDRVNAPRHRLFGVRRIEDTLHDE